MVLVSTVTKIFFVWALQNSSLNVRRQVSVDDLQQDQCPIPEEVSSSLWRDLNAPFTSGGSLVMTYCGW